MNLHDYLRLLRRGWWSIAALTLIGGLVALAFAYSADRVYQSTTTVGIATPTGADAAEKQAGNVFALQRAGTYAEMVGTEAVLDAVVFALGLDETVPELAARVDATARADTAIIDITVTGGDSAEVAREADAVAVALRVAVREFEGQNDQIDVIDIDVLQSAVPPEIAVAPQPRNSAIIGAAAGFALGVILLVLIEALDTRIRSPRDLAAATGRLAAAIVPEQRGRSTQSRERVREAYRTLRASIRHTAGGARTIAVAPVAAGRDSVEMAVELGRAMADAGARTVVIDTNIHQGTAGRRAQRSGDEIVGLADVLERRALLSHALTAGPAPNMWAMPAGMASVHSAQLLGTSTMTETLKSLTSDFDVVVLACPPLLERSDSSIVATLTDAAVIVVDARHTSRTELTFALDMLGGVGVATPSLVLHGVRRNDMVPARSTSLDGADAPARSVPAADQL